MTTIHTAMDLQKLTIILEEQPISRKMLDTQIENAFKSYKWVYPNEGDHDVLVSVVFPLRYVGAVK